MLKKMSAIIERSAHGAFLLGVLSGITMTGLIFVSTLMRYIGGRPVRFSDELAGLLFLSMTFLCLPYVLDKGRHIRIEIVRRMVPEPAASILDAIGTLTLVTFCVVFAYEAWSFMEFSHSIRSRTDISGILLWPWMTLMPISMLLCILVQCRHGIRQAPSDNVSPGEVAP